MPVTRSWADVNEARTQDVLHRLRVAGPAEVLTYDADKQLCNVQPLLTEQRFRADGQVESFTPPPLYNVPVLQLGGRGFFVHVPLEKGDTVDLLVQDRSIDRWKSRGGLVDPVDPRRHDLTDAVALPGLRSFARALSGMRSDALVLGHVSGPSLHLEAGAIRLGSAGAAQPLVLGDAFKGGLDVFLTALNTFAQLCSGPDPTAKATIAAAATALKNAVYLSTVTRTD